jgi:hypothetical protein
MRKYITASLMVLFLTSGIVNATAIDDINRNQAEWDMQKMKQDIKDIKEAQQEMQDAN